MSCSICRGLATQEECIFENNASFHICCENTYLGTGGSSWFELVALGWELSAFSFGESEGDVGTGTPTGTSDEHG